jgi:hypothetical protein
MRTHLGVLRGARSEQSKRTLGLCACWIPRQCDATAAVWRTQSQALGCAEESASFRCARPHQGASGKRHAATTTMGTAIVPM